MISDKLKKITAEWLEDIRYQSEGFSEYLGVMPPDDSSGWGEILCGYTGNSADSLRRKRGILLAGEKGSGKHTAARYTAVHMAELGYSLVFAGGDDFSVFSSEKSGIYEVLNELLDSYAESDLCLVLEFPEKCSDPRELMKRLGQFACMYAVHDDLPGLFIIVITEKENMIPDILRERLTLFRLSLPDQQQRVNFLRNNVAAMSTLFAVLTGGEISFEDFADAAEGMNYGQLRDALSFAETYVETSDLEDFSELGDKIREQIPPISFRDARMEMICRLGELAEKLPEAIEHMPAVAYSQSGEIAENRNSSDNMIESSQTAQSQPSVSQDDVDNMTGRELAYDVFGKEKTELLDKLVSEL